MDIYACAHMEVYEYWQAYYMSVGNLVDMSIILVHVSVYAYVQTCIYV